MVAHLDFLEVLQIGIEVLLGKEGGAVDTGKGCVVLVGTPVGGGAAQQFESLDKLGAQDMGAGAEVGEVVLRVGRDGLTLGNGVDEFQLVGLALGLKEFVGRTR